MDENFEREIVAEQRMLARLSWRDFLGVELAVKKRSLAAVEAWELEKAWRECLTPTQRILRILVARFRLI